MILSNEIVSQLSRVWVRLAESEKQIVSYLTKQEKSVTLVEVLQEMSDHYTPEIILNAIRSLKRRCLLEDNRNDEQSSLLKLDRTLEAYVRSHFADIA